MLLQLYCSIVGTVYSGLFSHIQGHSAIFSHVQAYQGTLEYIGILGHIQALFLHMEP